MTIWTSFKEGSVSVQALVRLQAPTFLGQEGTKIEMDVTFRRQMRPTLIQINVNNGGMSPSYFWTLRSSVVSLFGKTLQSFMSGVM